MLIRRLFLVVISAICALGSVNARTAVEFGPCDAVAPGPHCDCWRLRGDNTANCSAAGKGGSACWSVSDCPYGPYQDATKQNFDGDTADAPGETMLGNEIFSAFRFREHYGNYIADYWFTDVQKNSSRILLKGWQHDTVHGSWDAATLSDSSRTKYFTMATGDTISFYREFGYWNQSNTSIRSITDFVSDDTLVYTIQLVDSASGAYLARLDTMCVLKQSSPGRPTIYAERPIVAKVKWVVPSGLNGQKAFLSVQVETRGNGDYYMGRKDCLRGGASAHMNDQAWTDYLTEFGDVESIQ